MPPKDKYTDPKLRNQVKEEIHESDKGGAPGQWSARKAQMMASEYKKRGGGYTTDKEHGQDESQKDISKWTEEEWQTKEGSGRAKKDDGTEKRYLPKKAWEQMSEEEKQATDEKKQEESKQGKQFVGNTQTAKDARRKANKDGSDDLESRKQEQTRGTSGTSGTSGTKGKATDADEQEYDEEDDADAAEEEGYSYEEAEDGDYDEEGADDEEQVYDEDEVEEVDEVDGEGDGQKDDDEEVAHEDEAAPRGQKRGTGKQGGGPSKKQKDNSGKGKKNGTIGSKHDPAEAPAPPGSRDRVPEKGQKVVWRALPGYVDGEVVEILYSQKEVDGRQVKAKKDDPRAVLKSSSSGKICVHKLDAIYFDD